MVVNARTHMARVIALAVENVREGRGGPFAALVLRGDEVLAEGTNLVTSTSDPTAHAEIVAIRAACRKLGDFQLSGCDLFTSCEPCPMCMGAIYWARPARVWYAALREDAARFGFDDRFIYDELQVPRHLRAIPMSGLMREEALQAFVEWEAKPEKIRY
jgi:tRNA(Arg) A34 adenosine deaminase TadA